MKKTLFIGMICAVLGLQATAVLADPPLPPFYESVTKMAPNGKLGQIIKKEQIDRKSTRLNSSHSQQSRMPSSA